MKIFRTVGPELELGWVGKDRGREGGEDRLKAGGEVRGSSMEAVLDHVKVLRDREYRFDRECIHSRRRGIGRINGVEGCVGGRRVCRVFITSQWLGIFQKMAKWCDRCLRSTRRKGLEEGMGVGEKGEDREDARRQGRGRGRWRCEGVCGDLNVIGVIRVRADVERAYVCISIKVRESIFKASGRVEFYVGASIKGGEAGSRGGLEVGVEEVLFCNSCFIGSLCVRDSLFHIGDEEF